MSENRVKIRLPKGYVYTEPICDLNKVDKQEIKSKEVFSEVLKREERKLNEMPIQKNSNKRPSV